MALSDITNSILAQAKEEANLLVQKAKEEALQKKEEATVKAQKIQENTLAQAEKKAIQVKTKAKSLARMEARSSFVQKKRELLNEVKETTLKKLLEMPSAEQKKFLQNLFDSIDFTNGVIFPSKNQKKEISEIIHQSKHNYTLGETIDAQGGFIIEDGAVSINATFEHIVAQTFSKSEPEIISTLFRA